MIHTKRHSQEEPGKEKTELSLAGSLRSAGSMATSAGSAIIQKVVEKTRALSGSQMTQSQMSQMSHASHMSRDSALTGSQLSSITLQAGHSKQASDATMVTSDDHINSGRAMLSDQPSLASGDLSQHADSDMTDSNNDGGLHPLPMPEFGGWFAPLTEFLPDPTIPITNFHRCNLAMILLTELVVDGLDLDCHSVDWSAHMPLMLHIIFLGMDNAR